MAEAARRRFTAEEYHRMARAGILRDERVELLDGEIVDVSPIGPRHAAVLRRLERRLREAVGSRALVSTQLPIRLGRRSEPQPDLVLLRPRADDYEARHPSAADVLLAVEVADTSTAYDRAVKVPLYARHGLVETWIVRLDIEAVEVHRDPRRGTYVDRRTAVRGGGVSPSAFPQVVVPVDKLFGR